MATAPKEVWDELAERMGADNILKKLMEEPLPQRAPQFFDLPPRTVPDSPYGTFIPTFRHNVVVGE